MTDDEQIAQCAAHAMRQQTVDTTLARDGIVQIPRAWDLIPVDLLRELRETIETLPAPSPSSLKSYLVQYLGRYPAYDRGSIYMRIAQALMPYATRYLHARAQIHHYNVWRSLVTTEPPSQSQLWHQDREDRSLLKAFYYLTDVTEDAGPLSYIPGTHWRGTRVLEPPGDYVSFGSSRIFRVTDEQMAQCVPREDWVTATGPAGTWVLADTTGWHKGGYATGRERLVAVWHWTTDQCPHPVRFSLPGDDTNPWETP